MLLLDLHFAGTDTSSNTILTALLYLTTYRDAQGGQPNLLQSHKHSFSLNIKSKEIYINKNESVKCTKVGWISKGDNMIHMSFFFNEKTIHSQGMLIFKIKKINHISITVKIEW